jgi:hypothetical protein
VSAPTAVAAPFLRAASAADASATWTRRATVLACALLISTQPLSFLNMVVELHPSLLVAMAMVLLMLWHAPQVLAELSRPGALLITLSLAWQVITLLGYTLSLSRVSYWANASLAANALSYILIPQTFCLLLGLGIGRDPRAIDRVTRYILIANCIAITIGIIFYFTRPAFVLAAETRVFGYQTDMYQGFLPRMHGYLNSMVLGAACYTALGIATFRPFRPAALFGLSTLCVIGSVLTMQRASWILTGGAVLLALAAALGRGAAQWHRPKAQVTLLATIGLIAVVLAAAWRFAQDQPWFSITVQEFDSRVTLFGTLVEERSDQWVAGVQLVTAKPLGVGLGMLSHKAAEIEGLFPYAVTDGNLFRIVAETGIPGITLFALLVIIGLTRVAAARRFDVAAPMALLLVGAMGSNVFDLYYIGFVFWLLLGIAVSIPMRPAAPTTAVP